MDNMHSNWLTLDFLNQCLHSEEKYRTSTVATFAAESALPPGNNYGSYILRVRLTLREEPNQKYHTLSLIMKCPLEGALKDVMDQKYLCESLFYNDVVPLGQKLFGRTFFADHFYSALPKVVVLEDLIEKGYLMVDRTQQLDFDHCQLYMEAAANFHAMSVVVCKKDPDLIHRLGNEKFFSNDLAETQVIADNNIIKYCLECMANRASKVLGEERIERILRKCSESLWEMLVEAVKPSKYLNTFNQGDPWTTNMMFKYSEEGKVCDIKLLDFQNLRYSSPVSDLVFFIWGSANIDVLKHKQDILYEIYIENFNKSMAEKNLEEKLTMDVVKKEILKLSPLVLWTTAFYTPLFLNPSCADMESLFTKCKEDFPLKINPLESLYSENFSKHHFPELIQLLDSTGVFDYLESKLE